MIQITITNEDTEETVKRKILQAQDQMIREMLVQGTSIIYRTGNKPARKQDDPEAVRNRIRYLERRLHRQQPQISEWMPIERWMFLKAIHSKDCCGTVREAIRRTEPCRRSG